MYTLTAKWYEALYHFKDYRQEAEEIEALIRKHNPDAETVLDVACGSGKHGGYLSKQYCVDGIDINDDFLAIASRKNPKGIYTNADMAGFSLERKYDCIICMFSSIGYVKTSERLCSTIQSFADHLRDNGVVIVEPWFTKEAWRPSGEVYMITGETDEGKICRMNISETDESNALSIMNMNYLIGTKDGVVHVMETHELGLFSRDEMETGFGKAGLSVEYYDVGPSGKGLYVGRN